MAITKYSTKKTSKKFSKKRSKKKEDPFSKYMRMGEEKEAADLVAKAQAKKDAEAEEKRKHKIIYKYMVDLEKKLTSMKNFNEGFLMWTDDSSHKKISISNDDMQKKYIKM